MEGWLIDKDGGGIKFWCYWKIHVILIKIYNKRD